MSESNSNSSTNTAAAASGGDAAAAQAAQGATSKAEANVASAEGGEGSEKSEVKLSAKDSFYNRIRQAFEGHEFADGDEEGLYSKANERFQQLSDYQAKNEKANKVMTDVFRTHPELSGFMLDVAKGAPLNIAFIRNFDPDILTSPTDDQDPEVWKSEKQKRLDRLAEADKYQKEVDANIDFSRNEIKAFASENDLSKEQAEQFITTVSDFIDNAVKGRIDKKTLSNFYRAMSYETDVANAKEQGEVAGRNANIEAKKAVDESVKGDGLPDLNAGNKDQATEKKIYDDPFNRAIAKQLSKKRI